MQFVHNEVEYVGCIGLKPLPGPIKDRTLNAPHKHDVEHRVVGDEYVRGGILHIPAGPHFTAVETLKKAIGWGASNEEGIAFGVS
jgi:hypothetical protein